MQLFLYISDFIVPFLILAIVAYGILQEVSVYDNFIIGARNGFLTVIKIMPTLIGISPPASDFPASWCPCPL